MGKGAKGKGERLNFITLFPLTFSQLKGQPEKAPPVRLMHRTQVPVRALAAALSKLN